MINRLCVMIGFKITGGYHVFFIEEPSDGGFLGSAAPPFCHTWPIFLVRKRRKRLKSSIEASTAQTIEQFASHVVTLLTQVEDTGNQVVSCRTTQEWLTVHLNPDSTIQERVLTKQRLREYFSSYAVNNSNGISISAFAEDAGGVWTQDRTVQE